MAGNLDDVLSVTQPLNRFQGTFHGLKITNWYITWHGNCLLTGFDFPIKILLAIITFLFWILLCYLLNMSSFCISWCCFVVTLLHCSSHVPHYSMVFWLFCQYSVVCSASVPVFHQCSVFHSFSVPGFIVCHEKQTMTFDQLTEYNMRDIFLEKSYTK